MVDPGDNRHGRGVGLWGIETEQIPERTFAMDPIQAIAARHVSQPRRSEAEEIEAFYNSHAFAGLHEARRRLLHLVQLLRDWRLRIADKAQTKPEIASTAGRV